MVTFRKNFLFLHFYLIYRIVLSISGFSASEFYFGDFLEINCMSKFKNESFWNCKQL